MIRKKFIFILVAAIIAITTFISVSSSFNSNNFETVKQHLNYDRSKLNNEKSIFTENKVEYEINNDNTELITGLISFGGETNGCDVIETKVKDLAINKQEIKIVINMDIDFTKSYYVAGEYGNNNNFIEKGNRIIFKTKELLINTGFYYLHLIDNSGINYNSYLELGFQNWWLNINPYKVNIWPLATSLKVYGRVDGSYTPEMEQFIIFLNNYKYDIEQNILNSIKYFNKGFNFNFNDLSISYKDLIDPVYYNENLKEKINIRKIDNIVIYTATRYLQNAINITEKSVNTYGYNINEIINYNELPQTKSDIDNYKNGLNFRNWLQTVLNNKFHHWELLTGLTSGIITWIIFLIIISLYFYLRYKKIHQPLILKEFRLNKEQIKSLKNKKTTFYIYQFIKLNSKFNKPCFWKNYKFKSFSIIQKSFKNNLPNIKLNKYDNIFYNKKNNKYLLGKEFINIFLNSQDEKEYINKIKINFPNCFSQKLHKRILKDVLFFDINKVKNSAILISEINFTINTKMQLAKIRLSLENKEWSYYLFDLQNLMHLTLIKFLNWKDKGLNFNAYGKVLKRKLFWILQSEEKVEYYLQIIQTINYYRNLLSKASPSRYIKLEEWNQLKEQEQEDLMWKIYFSLVEFINFTENHLNE